jgi:hypothetical protein
LTKALVTKLIAERDGNVTGVEFVHVGKSLKVGHSQRWSHQVSTILEPSGIGNLVILNGAAEPFIVDNASIGENFLDGEGEISLDILQDPAAIQSAFEEYWSITLWANGKQSPKHLFRKLCNCYRVRSAEEVNHLSCPDYPTA